MASAGETPPILMSEEEKVVSFYLVVAVIIGIFAATSSVALVIRALPKAGEPLDIGRLGTSLAVMGITWSAILFAIFGRWPGTVSSRASIDVSAGPYEAWNAFALRDDYPGWKRIYTGVERLNEPGEVYCLHYAEDSQCPRCRLPRNPDKSRWLSRVEILEARRPSLYRQRCFPKALSALHVSTLEFLDSEETMMVVDSLGDGKTRLTFSSVGVRPKMWMAFLMLLDRPAKEHLRSLKAHLEGSPDESLFGVSAKRTELAREAPQYCSCPEDV